jgi:hypothetical protein
LEEVDVAEIHLDIWLYGNLARYGGEADQRSHANLIVTLRRAAPSARCWRR